MLGGEPQSNRLQRSSNPSFTTQYTRVPQNNRNSRNSGFNPYERSRVQSPRDNQLAGLRSDNRIGRNADNLSGLSNDNRIGRNNDNRNRIDRRPQPVQSERPALTELGASGIPGSLEADFESVALDPISLAIASDDLPDDGYPQRRKPRKDKAKEDVKEYRDYRDKDKGKDKMKSKDKSRKGGKGATRGGRRRDDDDEMDDEDISEMIDRRREEKRKRKEAEAANPTAIPIVLPQFISVSNLGKSLRVKPDVFLSQLAELGFDDITPDSIMTGETAALVAQEYGYDPSLDMGEDIDLKPRPAPSPEDIANLPERPPIVTIMGHVDHGKTTMLDWLRKSSVVSQEHGGITQHIGAFSVQMSNGKQITFLDTPGHAAFLTMRQRGANVTDIIVLVVAADDSVKPQTLEALKHARAANVPIIVAINKVDKDEARVDNVKADLARHGVEIEDFGGDVQVVCVSGRTGLGMEDLEESVLTLSEILDVRAENDGMVEGWVLESSVKPVGRAASVLVKRGTLRKGDIIAAGTTWAKVRLLRNEAGLEIEEAPPGTPVEVLGWRELPNAGDEVIQAPDQSRVKEAIAHRLDVEDRQKAMTEHEAQEVRDKEKALQDEELAASLKTTTGKKTRRQREEEAAAKAAAVKAAKEKEEEERNKGPVLVNYSIKGDVMGSVEAVCASIQEIGNNEVLPRILASSPGAITEWDVEHATVTKSTIVNFNLPLPGSIKKMAEDAGVTILDYNVIYHLTDRIKEQLSVHLAPKITYKVLGEAEVLQVFPINLTGRVFKNVAGCRVRNGQLMNKYTYRVFRGNDKVYEGKLETLKQGKKDAAEVHKGGECGISFLDWDDIQAGDKIQAYEEIHEKRTL